MELELEQRVNDITNWSIELTDRVVRTIGSPEKTLYHYTNSAGLLGLVGSGKVWATHVSRLNDKTEYDLGLSLVESYARNCVTRLPELVEKALEELRKRDTYVSCFSGTRDLLSQWRAYSSIGVGYCIGFESEKMATLDDRMPLLEKVIYEQSKVKSVVQQFILESDQYLHSNQFGDVEVGHIIGFLSGILNVVACSTKHHTFAEENEFRFIYQPELMALDLKPKYRQGQFGLTPYVAIDFIEKGRLPISSVTIGPCEDMDLEHQMLDHMLFSHGYEDVEILYSEIPLRK